MREILFRGKEVKTGKWIEGYYCHYDDIKDNGKDDCDYIIEKHNGEYFPFKEVIHETVGQFTGFSDKHKVKIFDGDIVKDAYGRIMEVVFRDNVGAFAFKLVEATGERWTNNFLYASMGEWFVCNKLPEVAVIGNIHDNPELLEKTE